VDVCRLLGRASDGAFPNERMVVVQDYSGTEAALLVQASRVIERGNQVAVEVTVLSTEGDLSLVRLPGELITSGRTLSVKNSQLENV
jgi:hypothetical protein